MKAYEEIVNFIAPGPYSDTILGVQASEKTSKYVSLLIQKEKEGSLDNEERSEPNTFVRQSWVSK